MGNYYPYNKISDQQFREIAWAFAEDKTATQTALKLAISVRTINDYYINFRKVIHQCCATHKEIIPVNMIDSYIGWKKSKTLKHAWVLGMFQCQNQFATCCILQENINQLFPHIEHLAEHWYHLQRRVESGKKIGHYYGIVDVQLSIKNLFIQYRLSHQFKQPTLLTFLHYGRYRLAQQKGVSNHTFPYHIKETEYRYNHTVKELYQLIMTNYSA